MENEKLIVGKKYTMHGYKHDGKIHRSWDEAVLLEIIYLLLFGLVVETIIVFALIILVIILSK